MPVSREETGIFLETSGGSRRPKKLGNSPTYNSIYQVHNNRQYDQVALVVDDRIIHFYRVKDKDGDILGALLLSPVRSRAGEVRLKIVANSLSLPQR